MIPSLINENSSREDVLAALKINVHDFQKANKLLRKDPEIILEVLKLDGDALLYADESLTKDASFFWRVWHIQESECSDARRKSYINRYLLQETSRIFIGAVLTIASGLLLSSISTLPFPVVLFPALLILIAATALGADYTFNKLAEHGNAFFKARAEFSTPATENVLTI